MMIYCLDAKPQCYCAAIPEHSVPILVSTATMGLSTTIVMRLLSVLLMQDFQARQTPMPTIAAATL
jgi:hypothetical protein